MQLQGLQAGQLGQHCPASWRIVPGSVQGQGRQAAGQRGQHGQHSLGVLPHFQLQALQAGQACHAFPAAVWLAVSEREALQPRELPQRLQAAKELKAEAALQPLKVGEGQQAVSWHVPDIAISAAPTQKHDACCGFRARRQLEQRIGL